MNKDIRLEIAERTLKSGLCLLAVRNPGVATFASAVSLDVRVGDEPAERSGLCNLLGDTLDEGTSRHDSLELSNAIESIGGALDGNSRGGTVICPAEARIEGSKLLREMLLEPTFPKREVERVKGEILTEILADADDPRTVASRRFRQEVYREHPLARPGHGTPQTLRKIDGKDLARFHRRMFAPHNGYVAVAGPDEPERMLDEAEKLWKGFRNETPEHTDTMPPERRPAVHDVHLAMPREQVHVFMGHLGIKRTDPDFYVLSVMDHILGTGPGFTSRCARKLRDEMGLCYSVSAGITGSAGEEPGMFQAYIGTSADHRQKAIAGFLEEIERIRREPPGEQELQDVVDYLTGSFVFGLERNLNLAGYAIRSKRFGLGFDFISRYPSIIRSITREQVREAAEKHLRPECIVKVSAGAGA